ERNPTGVRARRRRALPPAIDVARAVRASAQLRGMERGHRAAERSGRRHRAALLQDLLHRMGEAGPWRPEAALHGGPTRLALAPRLSSGWAEGLGSTVWHPGVTMIPVSHVVAAVRRRIVS